MVLSVRRSRLWEGCQHAEFILPAWRLNTEGRQYVQLRRGGGGRVLQRQFGAARLESCLTLIGGPCCTCEVRDSRLQRRGGRGLCSFGHAQTTKCHEGVQHVVTALGRERGL